MSEEQFLDRLFEQARSAMRSAALRKPYPPRSVAEGVRSMARHLQFSDQHAESLLEDAVLYQVFLSGAIASDSSNFRRASTLLPESFELLREHIASLKSDRPSIFLLLHMSGMPLVSMLANQACMACGVRNRHILIAPINVGWLNNERGRWAREAAQMIVADRRGIRTLITGLRDGSITHLGVLTDGPYSPSSPGARPVAGIPTLAFGTGALRLVFAGEHSLIPLIHYWERDRLRLEWPTLISPSDGIDAVARLIGEVLRKHPEQWLNWTAASLRT